MTAVRPETAADRARRTRAAQDLDPAVTDERVLAQVARIAEPIESGERKGSAA